MRKIKFSHRYLKLPIEDKIVTLLGIQKRKIETLPGSFLDYDTEYFMGESNEKGYYPLPEKGDVLILFFWGKHTLFTTIRTWNPEKERYYAEGVGAEFEVVVENEN